jgi:DNA polymerase-4
MARSSTILHLDMDAFFASVEQLRDPSLRGKAVIVGGIPGKDRSVVTSASYEARPFGVRAGMPIGEARRLCPHAIFVRTRGFAYLEISRRVVEIMNDFSDRVEPSSIDEAYMDITGVLKYWGGAEAIGRRLKERVRDELHLTCSVGVAPTRILAKLATDLNKPDGLTIIRKEDMERVVFPLPVEEVPGVGRRLKAALNEMGILTVGQLAKADAKRLYKRFGINGTRLQQIVRGELDWEVIREDERPDDKSVGHSRTFNQDTADPEKLKGYLLSLVQMVGRRLREGDYAGRTVTITIRYGDFSTLSHQRSMKHATNDENDIFKVAWRLFEEHYLTETPVRLLGVSVSGLVRRNARQLDLFDKESQLYPALDALREKFGEGIIRRTSTLDIHLRSHKQMTNFARPNVSVPKRRSG